MDIIKTIERASNQLEVLHRQHKAIETAVINQRRALENIKDALDSLTSPYSHLELKFGLLRSVKSELQDGYDLYEAIKRVSSVSGISADSIYSVWISNQKAEKEYKKYGKRYAVHILKKAGFNNRQIAAILQCSTTYIYTLAKE